MKWWYIYFIDDDTVCQQWQLACNWTAPCSVLALFVSGSFPPPGISSSHKKTKPWSPMPRVPRGTTRPPSSDRMVRAKPPPALLLSWQSEGDWAPMPRVPRGTPCPPSSGRLVRAKPPPASKNIEFYILLFHKYIVYQMRVVNRDKKKIK